MNPLFAIARTTIREALREKVLYGLVVFGSGMVLISLVISRLTLGHRIRVITDLSLTGLLASGVLLAVILGANSIARDNERRVALPLLAKPITRTKYILGRFMGVATVVVLNYFLMLCLVTLAISLHAPEGGFPYGWANYAATALLILFRIAILVAVSVSLSTFASSTVAQVAALGLAIAGHFTSSLRFFLGHDQGPFIQFVSEVVYRIVPDLGALDSLYELIHRQPIATSQLGFSSAYAVLYAGAALALSCWRFSRQEVS